MKCLDSNLFNGKRSQKSLRTYLLFAALIVTFIITTAQCGLDIALLQLRIESLLVRNPSLPHLLRVQLFGSQSWFIPAIIVEDIVNTGMDIGLLVCTPVHAMTFNPDAICSLSSMIVLQWGGPFHFTGPEGGRYTSSFFIS